MPAAALAECAKVPIAFEVRTQDVNVAACRFYARRGCMRWAVNRLARRRR